MIIYQPFHTGNWILVVRGVQAVARTECEQSAAPKLKRRWSQELSLSFNPNKWWMWTLSTKNHCEVMGLENKVLQYIFFFGGGGILFETNGHKRETSQPCVSVCVSVYVCDSSHAGMSVCRYKPEGRPAMCIVVIFKRNLWDVSFSPSTLSGRLIFPNDRELSSTQRTDVPSLFR